MKVLVILYKDSYNIPTQNVVKEMLARGYEVDLYSRDMNKINIRMFEGYNVLDYANFDVKTVEKYDFIYCAVSIEPNLVECKKYIFCYNNFYMDEQAGYGDYTFTQRDFSKELIENYVLNYPNKFVVTPGETVGNPKYDLWRNTSIQVKDKQILYIDAGHFPFGKEGKMQIAKCLLEIANRYEDYTIIIKPRFLPNEKGMAHTNSVHIYDCLNELANGRIPGNIVCLMKHVELEPLVMESQVILCTELTSSYLEIGAFNKRGIIIEGIHSEFTYSHSENHIRNFIAISNRSGLSVNYKRVMDYLPEGLNMSNSHMEEMGLFHYDSAKSIVDRMEKIYFEYLKKGIFLMQEGGISRNYEDVIALRYKKMLISKLSYLQLMIQEIDFSSLLFTYVNKSLELFKNWDWSMNAELDRSIYEIIIQNKNIAYGNKKLESYYLDALYKLGLFCEDIDDNFKENDMYLFILGKESAKNEDYPKAYDLLKEFVHRIKKHSFQISLADEGYYLESASYWLGTACYELGKREEALAYFMRCMDLTNGKHSMAQMKIQEIRGNL